MTDEAAKPPHILTAIDEIMNAVTFMGKDGMNRQQNFPFRSYDGVINAVGPAFRRHQVCPSYEVTSMERRTYTTKTGTNMQETIVRLTYTLTSLVDGSTHVLARDVPGESADAGDKSASKAVTVACRLALLHGFAIPTQDTDPDEQTVERAPEPPPAKIAEKKERDDMFAQMKAVADPALRKTVWSQFIANFGDLAVLPAADVDKAWAWIIEHEGPTEPDDDHPGMEETQGIH